MTEAQLQLIELINKKYSNNEIMRKLKLTPRQLALRLSNLKRKGFELERKYFSDGEVEYSTTKELSKKENEVDIITSPEEENLQALVISDTHFGRKKNSPFGNGERIDLIEECFNFCAKEGIHIIIHCGDFIDSFMYPKIIDISPIVQEKQIKYALKSYPYDKSINTFLCLGNHDYFALTKYGLNLSTILQEKRHDIVPIGFGYGKINIKNDHLSIVHKLRNGITPPIYNEENTFILKGHSHRMRYKMRSSAPVIYVPALLDEDENPNFAKSVLKLSIEFQNGLFRTCLIEQFLIDHGFQKISDCIFDLHTEKQVNNKKEVSLEETRVRRK